jgi:DNA-binding NarL/FixJ family response regulator
MIRILVVDDHPLVRNAIAQTLAANLADAEIGEASNAVEALRSIWEFSWNLVLLDLSLPGRSGLELLSEIHAARPRLPVLVLSMYPEEQFSTRVLKAGGAGYLSKSSSPEEVLRAVRQVLAGGKFITPAAASRLASELCRDNTRHPHETLSDREFDVMLRISRGDPESERQNY